MSDSISSIPTESRWLDGDYFVKVWTAALLRLGIAEYQGGEHLALIIWRQTAPPRSLQSATQSSGLGTTLPASPHTGSSAWEGDEESSYTLWINKDSVPPWCLLSNESVMRVAERRDGRFSSSMWTSGAQKCAPWFSIIITTRSWDQTKPKRRAEILTEPPCEVTRFFSFLLCVCEIHRPWTTQRSTHMLLYNTWIPGDWQKDVLCFWIHGRLIYQLWS